MNVSPFVLFAILVSGAACSGSSSSSGSCTQTSSMGGTSTTYCADFDDNYSSSTAQSSCGTAGGTYAASACTTANRVGHCLATNSAGTSQTLSFYSPTTEATARALCTVFNGTYTAG